MINVEDIEQLHHGAPSCAKSSCPGVGLAGKAVNADAYAQPGGHLLCLLLGAKQAQQNCNPFDVASLRAPTAPAVAFPSPCGLTARSLHRGDKQRPIPSSFHMPCLVHRRHAPAAVRHMARRVEGEAATVTAAYHHNHGVLGPRLTLPVMMDIHTAPGTVSSKWTMIGDVGHGFPFMINPIRRRNKKLCIRMIFLA